MRKLPAGALAAAAFIALIALAALFAPLAAPYDPDAQSLSNALSGPTAAHPLGTDKLGRDLLSRVVFGARSTLLSAFLVVILATALGVPLGLLAGYRGGILDAAISRAGDVLLAFPALLLALVVAAAMGRGIGNAVIALSVVYSPMIARLVRSACLVEKSLPYVEAERALGFGSGRIVFVHIFPNVAPLVLVQAAADFAYAVLDLSALSFLGLGARPPLADWGAMMAEGKENLLLAPHLAIVPGIAVMLTVVSFNLVADALRDQSAPRGGH